jgi:hypothetical protein
MVNVVKTEELVLQLMNINCRRHVIENVQVDRKGMSVSKCYSNESLDRQDWSEDKEHPDCRVCI